MLLLKPNGSVDIGARMSVNQVDENLGLPTSWSALAVLIPERI